MSNNLVTAAASSLQIVKRDGRVVSYDIGKVKNSVRRCLVQGCLRSENEETDKTILQVAGNVDKMAKKLKGQVSVEAIQDLVVLHLELLDKPAATHFRTYREIHRAQRDRVVLDHDTLRKFEDNKKHFTGLNRHLQEIQAFDKFSKFHDHLGRREVWSESVQRVMDYTRKHLRTDGFYEAVGEPLLGDLHRGLLDMQVSPAMRVVQMAGPALDRCQSGAYNCSYLQMDGPEAMAEDLYLLMQGVGVGFSVEHEHAINKWPQVKRQKNATVETFVIPDSTIGWCDTVKHGVQTWLNGGDVEFDFNLCRPAGARLKTKGGKSSGPAPLRDLLSFAKKRILAKQGRRLSSLDVHDITCFIHRIVLVGGVRRASGISLSDLDDGLLRDCKKGEFWNSNPQRDQANNSAVYDEKPDSVTFMREWLALADSKTGERGIFNRGGLVAQMPKRRRDLNQGVRFGVNPCFHPDTRLATAEGLIRIQDLHDAGDPNLVVTDNRVTASACEPKAAFGVSVKPATQVELTRADAELLELRTEHGQCLKVTDNHEFPTPEGRKRAGDLKPGDLLLLQSAEGRWGSSGSYADGLLLGFIAGDGCVTNQDSVIVEAYGCKSFCAGELLAAANNLANGFDGNNRELAWRTHTLTSGVSAIRLDSRALFRGLASKLGVEDVHSLKNVVPECVWTGSRDMVVGYLRGLFATDGHVNVSGKKDSSSVSLRLSQSNPEFLRQVQTLLQNFGVVSRLFLRRGERDGDFPGGRNYHCQADWELWLNRPNCVAFETRIGLTGPKAEQLRVALDSRGRACRKPERYVTQVATVLPCGKSAVYCLNEPETHSVIANGVVSAQCGEIVLRPKGLCNLSIGVARPTDSAEDLRKKLMLATAWGTIQSTMTNFRYLSPEWKKNCEEERLLGVDILGHMDMPALRPGTSGREDLLASYLRDIRKENERLAKAMGINPSAAVTCGKPSGDSSVFFDTSAGFKAHHGKHWLRRIRLSPNEVIARILIESGIPHQLDYNNTGTLVFEFPCKAPEGAMVLGDQSAIDQLENWRVFKVNFTEHNPSVTIYVRNHEWLEVGNWVYKNWDIVGGLSFYAADDAIYQLPPYEKIGEEEYDRRRANLPEIDWTRLLRYEKSDQTTLSQQLACTGGECALR